MQKQDLINRLKNFKLSTRQVGYLNGFDYIILYVVHNKSNGYDIYYHGTNEKPVNNISYIFDNLKVDILHYVKVNFDINKTPAATLKKQLIKQLKFQPEDYKIVTNSPLNYTVK